MNSPDGPGPARSPMELLADDMETSFNSIGHSLTDECTAEIFVHTLRLVERALEGAQAQDILTAEKRCELAALIEGMRAAPRLV